MQNKSVYIILSKTGTYFSNIISFFTKKEYSHASISLDNTFCNMYSFGRKVPELPFPGGFVQESLYNGVFANFSDSKCLIYKVDVTDEQYEIIKNELNNFINNIDTYKYNLLGTVFAYFDKPLKTDNKYFCSQFVSEILIKSGVYKSDKLPELVKPMDLLDIQNKTFIYEGLISESYFDGNYIRNKKPNISPSYSMLWYMFGKVKTFYLNYK